VNAARRGCLFTFVAIVGVSATVWAADDLASARALFAWPPFIAHAHSHNDYQQMRPLLDALRAGITSVEADLYFDRGTIRVAHDRGKWRGDFETLYLEPLKTHWERNERSRDGPATFLLWLDLKEASADLRTALHTMLLRYPMNGTTDQTRTRVQVILTGNDAAKKAYVADYRSSDVTRDSNTFSDADEPGSAEWRWYALDWSKLGTWTGEGPMPPHERDQLRQLVDKIHAKGRKLRLWHHPASLSFWKEAAGAGVDLLGTDLLPVAPLSAEVSSRR